MKKSILFYLLLVLISSPAICQIKQIETISKFPNNTIPIVYRGHIYIQGKADSVPGNFVFDTGASNLYFDSLYYADGHFQYENTTTAKLPGAGAKPQDVIVILDSVSFRFADYQYETNIVPVLQLKPILGDFSDGIIGLEYFAESIFELNYSQEYIILHQNNQSLSLNNYHKIELEKIGNRLFLPLSVQVNPEIKIEGRFQLDFGSGGTVTMTSSIAKKYNLEEAIEDKVAYFTKYGGVGGESSSFEFLSSSIDIGAFAFDSVVMEFSVDKSGALASTEHMGLLGNGILDRFDVLIDFMEPALYLKPNENYQKPFEFSRLGFGYVDRNQSMDAWIVTGLYKGSHAVKSGLRIDDQIIKVNNIPIAQIKYQSQASFFKNQNKISLTINRNGEEMDVKVKLEPVLE